MKIEGRTGNVEQINQHVAVLRLTGGGAPRATVWTHLILDCSTSTTPFHEDLKADAVKFVAALDERDHVSVEIFSGHGRAKVIATPTRCDADGKRLLTGAIEDDVRLLDVTVFSEPLQLTLDTMQRFMARMPDVSHSVVLFTDGCAVPEKWNKNVEEQKSLEIARAIGAAGAAFSVIGYGFYYDHDFLRRLMGEAGSTGIQRHISEINGFDAVVRDIRTVVGKTTLADVNVTIKPDKGKAGRVLKTTPDLIVAGEHGRCRTKSLYEDQAALFIELDQATTAVLIEGTIDGKKIEQRIELGALSDADAADFVRALGAAAFLDGNRERAAELLELLEEEMGAITEQLAFAFTDREVRQGEDTARRIFRDFSGFIGSGLKRRGPSHNVLNVLRMLVETNGTILDIPPGAYPIGGLVPRDPRVIANPNGRSIVKGFASKKNRWNFSLRVLKEVLVKAPKGHIADPKPMFVWRTYNIIRDGNVVMPDLLVTFTTLDASSAFEELQDAGVIAATEIFRVNRRFTLNLRDLRVISTNYARPRALDFVGILREEVELKAEQKALNARIAALGKPASDDEDGSIYRETPVEDDSRPVEYYWADHCTVELKGYSPREYDCSRMSFAQADTRMKHVRQRLIAVRYRKRSLCFAMEKVGSTVIPWSAPKAKKTKVMKNERLTSTATFNGVTLERKTWRAEIACN